MPRHMSKRPRPGERPRPHAVEEHGSDDRGVSLVEILVAITLMGTVVAAVISSVFISVKATSYERDHAKAQQWLQSAVGVIEAVDYFECADPLNGALVQTAYQDAVDGGAQRPWQYDGVLRVSLPEVWDGEKFVEFTEQNVCYDDIRLRQQRVTLEVNHPNGVTESVQMIKVDRNADDAS